MNNLVLYAENTYEVYRMMYRMIEWLVACVRKRNEKHQPVIAQHLAECSTMKKIFREAARYGMKYAEHYSAAERKEAREILADQIIEEAGI